MKGRLLSLCTTDVGGGAERMATSLHEGLRDRGWETRFLVGRKCRDDADTVAVHESPHFDYRTVERVPAVRFQGLVRARDRLLGREALHYPLSNWLPSIAGEEEPDAILAHNLHGGFFDLRVLSGLSHRFRVFWFLHDLWPLTGHCAFPVGCERWRTGCGHCPDLGLPPAVLRDHTRGNLAIKKEIYRNSRLHLVVPCHWLAEQVKRSVLGEFPLEISVIPYGIDLEKFRPAVDEGARETSGETLGVFLANDPERNPYKDFALLSTMAPELDACLAGAGREGGGERGRVRLLAVGAPEAKTVYRGRFVVLELVPWTTPDEIAALLRRASFLVHPSKAEITPVAIHEAMASGLPVIASDVGGVPEMLRSGDEGLLLAGRRADDWREAILDLISRPEEWKARGARAYERAERLGGTDRMLVQVEKLLESGA